MGSRVLEGATEHQIDRAVMALFDLRQTHLGDFDRSLRGPQRSEGPPHGGAVSENGPHPTDRREGGHVNPWSVVAGVVGGGRS